MGRVEMDMCMGRWFNCPDRHHIILLLTAFSYADGVALQREGRMVLGARGDHHDQSHFA